MYLPCSFAGRPGEGSFFSSVALKILPEHLSERADLRERFEREARAVSSLTPAS